jgi:hypothetical protein
MATFRQNQIDEILNYDRAMNRIVLDNEIGQATRFNDERRPPSNRDIKFEALIGTLIDALKAKIAESLQLIASKQYPKIDAQKVSALLDLNTNPSGKVVYKNQNHEAIEKALKQQEDYNKSTKAVKEAQAKSTKASATPAEVNEDEEAEKAQPTEQGAINTVVPAPKVGTAAGKPSSLTRQFRLYKGRGGTEPEEKAGETRDSLEQDKSQKQTSNAVENVLYDIVNQYNGIIDKLLQATQPDGKYASKRSTSSSNINYLADVLKGLNEPLKHLVFELSQVHNPNLASILNMLTSMVEVIDVSPPFQKVNVSVYKNGMPDFQGLNNTVQVIDVDGYIADIEKYKAKLEDMHYQIKRQLSSMLFNATPQLQNIIKQQLEEKEARYKETIDKINTEVKIVKKRAQFTKEFTANYDLIKEAHQLYGDYEDTLHDLPKEVQEGLDALNPPPGEQPPIQAKSPDESDIAYIVRVNKALKTNKAMVEQLMKNKADIEEYNETAEVPYDIEEIDKKIQEGNRVIRTLEEDEDKMAFLIKIATEKPLPRKTANVNPIRRNKKLDFNIENRSDLEFNYEYNKLLREPYENIKALYRKAFPGEKIISFEPSVKYLMEKKFPGHRGLKGLGKKRQVMGMGRKRQVMGHGGSGGLADLLAERKPQYSYGREDQVYDFDKQHNELMKSERNWQSKSNPPHTTPVGKLYPFYKKDEASMYSFPLKLKNELAKTKPDDTQKDAIGADVSLLQGPIGGPQVKEKMPVKKHPKRVVRTNEEAVKNVIKGQGKKKNPKALHKIIFNDEDNEEFEDEEMPHSKDGGMIPEEADDMPEDRFRNKKLGPPKKKYGKK